MLTVVLLSILSNGSSAKIQRLGVVHVFLGLS